MEGSPESFTYRRDPWFCLPSRTWGRPWKAIGTPMDGGIPRGGDTESASGLTSNSVICKERIASGMEWDIPETMGMSMFFWSYLVTPGIFSGVLYGPSSNFRTWSLRLLHLSTKLGSIHYISHFWTDQVTKPCVFQLLKAGSFKPSYETNYCIQLGSSFWPFWDSESASEVLEMARKAWLVHMLQMSLSKNCVWFAN